MTCDKYWRDGVLLVERGLADPHRAGCADCTRAHASRQELIEALPLVGVSYAGDPQWQQQVWQRIREQRDEAPARPPWWSPWQWQFSGALIMACAVVLWFGLLRRPSDSNDSDSRRSPEIAILPGEVPMRSERSDSSARYAAVGEYLRVRVGKTSDVWIYRNDRPVLRCGPRELSTGCMRRPGEMEVEVKLRVGEYRVIVVEGAVVDPGDTLDEDLAELEKVNARYIEQTVSVQ